MTPIDVVIAAGLFAMSIGIGWTLYRTRMERVKADAISTTIEDPIGPLREVNDEILGVLKESAAITERVVHSVQKGVR